MKTLTWKNGKKVIRDMTDDEIAAITPSEEALAQKARKRRDDFLAASDWTQALDAPVNQSAWAEYRQALRDVPSQSTFPRKIVWPQEP